MSKFPWRRRIGSSLAKRPVTTDSQSNRQPFAGRLYVIVLDDQDVSVMRTSHTKRAARQFVEQYMGANDVAAVIHTSGRTDAAQEFTSNKQLLLAAIDKFVGRRMRSLTLERLDQYYQQVAMLSSDQSTERRPTISLDRCGRARQDCPIRAISSADSAPSACSTR